MTSVRRQLRLFVAAWLVFQAASLAALVPRECCAAHRQPAAAEGKSCHRMTAPAAHCPMRATNGTPCPMHRGGHSEAPPASDCSLRGSCEGPMAALFVLLSHHGVLADRSLVPLDLAGGDILDSPDENLISTISPPDAPPPRA